MGKWEWGVPREKKKGGGGAGREGIGGGAGREGIKSILFLSKCQFHQDFIQRVLSGVGGADRPSFVSPHMI